VVECAGHINDETPAYGLSIMLHRDNGNRWFHARERWCAANKGRQHGGTNPTSPSQARRGALQGRGMNRRIVEHRRLRRILGLDGELLYINPEGLRALELTDAGGLLTRLLADFFYGDTRRGAEDAIGLARQGGRGRFQYLMRTASGVPKWWDAVVTPISPLLSAVKPGVYDLSALPLRLVGADASPVRAVLIAKD
jgi:PAS domain-containing protein